VARGIERREADAHSPTHTHPTPTHTQRRRYEVERINRMVRLNFTGALVNAMGAGGEGVGRIRDKVIGGMEEGLKREMFKEIMKFSLSPKVDVGG